MGLFGWRMEDPVRQVRNTCAQPRASEVARNDGPSSRVSIYDEVTARICAELAEGRLPWVQPWTAKDLGTGGTGSACLPGNAVTARPYSGINILLLWGAAQEGGYPSQGWLTFRQALAAGGCVRIAAINPPAIASRPVARRKTIHRAG